MITLYLIAVAVVVVLSALWGYWQAWGRDDWLDGQVFKDPQRRFRR
jgi:hypothetical protein